MTVLAGVGTHGDIAGGGDRGILDQGVVGVLDVIDHDVGTEGKPLPCSFQKYRPVVGIDMVLRIDIKFADVCRG